MGSEMCIRDRYCKTIFLICLVKLILRTACLKSSRPPAESEGAERESFQTSTAISMYYLVHHDIFSALCFLTFARRQWLYHYNSTPRHSITRIQPLEFSAAQHTSGTQHTPASRKDNGTTHNNATADYQHLVKYLVSIVY